MQENKKDPHLYKPDSIIITFIKEENFLQNRPVKGVLHIGGRPYLPKMFLNTKCLVYVAF